MTGKDSISEAQADRHNALWRQATQLANRVITIHERSTRRLGWIGRIRARRALKLLNGCAAIAGETWQNLWFQGKIYQALGDHERSFAAFAKAAPASNGNPDAWREATLAAMSLGRAAEAASCAREAIRFSPGDPGLYANLSLALVLCGDDAGAVEAVERALQMDPKDPVTRTVHQIVSDVRAGRRPRPTSY